MTPLAAVGLAYLVGAVPVGFLVARMIPWLRPVEFKARVLGKVVTVLQLLTLAAVLVFVGTKMLVISIIVAVVVNTVVYLVRRR